MLQLNGPKRIAFNGRRLTVAVQPVLNSESNKAFDYEVLCVNNAVAILPIQNTPSGPQYILLKHNRLPVTMAGYVGPICEVCAGVVGDKTADEDLLAAAQRELLEETGFTAAKWIICGTFFTSPGITTETVTLMIAENLAFVGQQLEDSEKGEIEVVHFAMEEAYRLVMDGHVSDMKTATLIMRHQLMIRSSN